MVVKELYKKTITGVVAAKAERKAQAEYRERLREYEAAKARYEQEQIARREEYEAAVKKQAEWEALTPYQKDIARTHASWEQPRAAVTKEGEEEGEEEKTFVYPTPTAIAGTWEYVTTPTGITEPTKPTEPIPKWGTEAYAQYIREHPREGGIYEEAPKRSILTKLYGKIIGSEEVELLKTGLKSFTELPQEAAKATTLLTEAAIQEFAKIQLITKPTLAPYREFVEKYTPEAGGITMPYGFAQPEYPKVDMGEVFKKEQEINKTIERLKSMEDTMTTQADYDKYLSEFGKFERTTEEYIKELEKAGFAYSEKEEAYVYKPEPATKITYQEFVKMYVKAFGRRPTWREWIEFITARTGQKLGEYWKKKGVPEVTVAPFLALGIKPETAEKIKEFLYEPSISVNVTDYMLWFGLSPLLRTMVAGKIKGKPRLKLKLEYKKIPIPKKPIFKPETFIRRWSNIYSTSTTIQESTYRIIKDFEYMLKIANRATGAEKAKLLENIRYLAQEAVRMGVIDLDNLLIGKGLSPYEVAKVTKNIVKVKPKIVSPPIKKVPPIEKVVELKGVGLVGAPTAVGTWLGPTGPLGHLAPSLKPSPVLGKLPKAGISPLVPVVGIMPVSPRILTKYLPTEAELAKLKAQEKEALKRFLGTKATTAAALRHQQKVKQQQRLAAQQRAAQRTRLATTTILGLKTLTAQQQKAALKTQQRLRAATRPVTRVVGLGVPPRPLIPPPIFYLFGKVPKPKKPLEKVELAPKGFFAFFRRKGKWIRVRAPPVVRTQALWLGKEKVARTLAATFKIAPAHKPAVKIGIPKVTLKDLMGKFYIGKKPEEIIEKRKFRLDVPEEVKEIQYWKKMKGGKAKKAKKIKWF